jgi:hypothetical protein
MLPPMMRCDMILDLLETIKENLEHKDGILYWKKTSGRKIKGKQAGWINKGYVMVGIGGQEQPAHRIIFLLEHGYCPEFIDHIDGNRSNNKIENLRQATLFENARNSKRPSHNTSGYKGVCWDKNRNKWMAHITINQKFKSLGRYNNIDDARIAYANAAKHYFGKFARIE